MSTRTTRHLAWGLWALAVALTGLYAALVVLDAGSPGPLQFAEEWPVAVLYGVLAVTLPTIGALIASRQPRNAIGWMFCAAGIAMAGGFSATLYGDYGTYVRPGLPGAAYAALGNHLFIVGLSLATIFLLFLFPTGRPLSPAWRRVVLGMAAVFAVGMVSSLLQPGPVDPFTDIQNPLGLAGPAGQVAGQGAMLLDASAPVAFALGVWTLVARFRRSRGMERQQLKWFAYAAGLMGGSLAVGFTFSGLGFQLASDLMWVTAMLALMFVPIAVGLAILRHGLYEIDRIVSRTVSYALLTALLGGIYLGGVLLLAPLVGRGSELAVAGATLAVAAAFQPARGRIQAMVDRRFNRARYDAQRTVAAFAVRLRDAVDLDELRAELVGVVRGSVEPAAVSLWLRGGARP